MPQRPQYTRKDGLARVVKLKDFIDDASKAETQFVKQMTWEQKLGFIDLMIAKGIEKKNFGSLGYLVEFREGVIQEKFDPPQKYFDAKQEAIDEFEVKEEKARTSGYDQTADKIYFDKINQLIVLQNEYLRTVYPTRILFTGVEAI